MTDKFETIAPGVARRTFSPDRVNIPQTISWVEKHPNEFNDFVQAFDSVVDRFSTYPVPPENVNQAEVRKLLKGRALPTISSLFATEGVNNLRLFIHTLRNVNEQMHRGETTLEQPFLRFHTTVTDDKQAILAGCVFHVYEEFVLANPNFADLKRGQVVDSLVEVLAGDTTNSLYHPIADRQRLNWIEGWQGFTSEFRKAHGFS